MPPALVASAAGYTGGLASPSMPSEQGLAGTPSVGIDATAASQPLDLNAYVERSLTSDEPWTWQLLPAGLMYKSYLAGNREPRIG